MRSLMLTLFALPVALVAQAPGGPLVGLPHGYSVDPGTLLPGSTASKLQFSNAGIDATQPSAPIPSSAIPDFTTYLGGAPVDVNGFSLGWDWVVANAIGEAVVAPPQWAAVTGSVTPGTVGLPGSLVSAEGSALGGVAADIIGYVIPGSSLPPAIVGTPFRAQDALELNPLLAGTPGNLDAHDIYVSLIYLENPQLAPLLPPATVYFTVTAATAPLIPAAWITSPTQISGATVFSTTWIPTTMSWTPPAVAFEAADFGIDVTEDIDALAIDSAQGTALFSTDLLLPAPVGPARNPLLWTVLGSGIHFIYRLPNGTPLSTELGLGLGSDDIDGICSLDPGSAANPSPINLPLMLGTPLPPLPFGVPNDLRASAYRTFDPFSQQEFANTWMVGWPPPGNQQLSLAVSAAALGNPGGPYIVLDVFTRPQPTNQYEGHPEHTYLQIPPSVSMTGQQLFFLWGALSPSTFDMSLPLRLVL